MFKSKLRASAHGLLAEYTHTLAADAVGGSLRTPATCVGKSQFVPRVFTSVAQYEVKAEDPKAPRSLPLTSLSALADLRVVEDGNGSYDSSPSSGSTNKCQKKSKGKRYTQAIATAKVRVELQQFRGKNLDKWAEEFSSFLTLTEQINAPVRIVFNLN